MSYKVLVAPQLLSLSLICKGKGISDTTLPKCVIARCNPKCITTPEVSCSIAAEDNIVIYADTKHLSDSLSEWWGIETVHRKLPAKDITEESSSLHQKSRRESHTYIVLYCEHLSPNLPTPIADNAIAMADKCSPFHCHLLYYLHREFLLPPKFPHTKSSSSSRILKAHMVWRSLLRSLL